MKMVRCARRGQSRREGAAASGIRRAECASPGPMVLHRSPEVALAHMPPRMTGTRSPEDRLAVDVELRRADHEIDVRMTDVSARCRQLLFAHLAAALKTRRIRHADSQVTRRVLVQQRVEEGTADIAGGVPRDQRDLAEVVRAIVGLDHALEHVVASGGREVDDAPLREGQAEVLDQHAADREWQGRAHRPADAVALRQGEDLLRRHVRHEVDAALAGFAAAEPDVACRQINREVSARRAVAQPREARRIEGVHASRQAGDVRLPGGDGVRGVEAHHVEDVRPQALQSFGLVKLREDLSCPGGRRNRADAPRDLAAL